MSKLGSKITGFLILAVLALAFLFAGFALGIEPRMVLDRTTPNSFRVTGSNQFSGWRFYSKTIEGVETVTQRNAERHRRGDSQRENSRRREMKHLEFVGSNGARLGWDREDDQSMIEAFMRGQEPSLALADRPPLWRICTSWFLIAFGALVFWGAIQNSFFSKKSGLP
jgi:hypothetical protein